MTEIFNQSILVSSQIYIKISEEPTYCMENSCQGFWSTLFSLPSWYLFPHDFSSINGCGLYCVTQKVYTVFRLSSMLILAGIFAYVALFYQPKDLLYFTTWGLILTLFTYIILAIQNILNYCFQFKTTLKYWKISHFLFTISLFFELFINGVYWLGLFPYAVLNLWGELVLVDILNPILAHAGPLFILILDFQINQVNIWNFGFIPYYYGILIAYLIVNAIYSTRVQEVYALISYQNWITAILIIGCGVAVIVVHLIVRIFCKYYKQAKVLELLGQSDEKSLKATAEDSGNTLNQNDQVIHRQQVKQDVSPIVDSPCQNNNSIMTAK